MKKIHSIVLLLSIIVLTTTSCNQTWQCECKEGGTVVSIVPIKTLGRGGAKNVCDSYQVQNNLQGARQVCSIK